MRSLVVGVDGSPGADRALQWAAREARLWAARLHIVHCYPMDRDTGLWLDEDRQAATDRLDDITDRARKHLAGLEWDAQVEWAPSGSWAYKLVDRARGADVLVVGSRGLGGFLQLLMGSVSHHVSTYAPTTVAVVRDRADAVADSGDVVVGVDGSAPSLRALHWGAREAARRGVGLLAVHAYAVPSAQRYASGGGGADAAARAHDRARAAATELLAGAVDRAQLPADAQVRQLVAAGSPAGVLVSTTRPEELLVCGPRGLSPLQQKVLGSVSDQCLRHAQAPVVLVRHAPPPVE